MGLCAHLIGQLEKHKHLLLKETAATVEDDSSTTDKSSTHSSNNSSTAPGQELLYKLIELILHAMRSSTKSSTNSSTIAIQVSPLVLLESVQAIEKLPQLFSASLSLMYTPPIVAVLIDLLAKLNSAPTATTTPHDDHTSSSQNGSAIAGPLPKKKASSSTILMTSSAASPSNSASSLFAAASTSQAASPSSSSSAATLAETETFIEAIVNTLKSLLQPKSKKRRIGTSSSGV